MKRSFKFIVSILVVILCISSFSLMLDVFKDNDKSSGNRSPSVIVPIDPDDTEEPEEPSPEDSELVRRVINDNETSIVRINKNNFDAFEYKDDILYYNGPNPCGEEYVDLLLVNKEGEFANGIMLSEYSKIEILMDYYFVENDSFNHSFFIVGRAFTGLEKPESSVSEKSEVKILNQGTDEYGFERFNIQTVGYDITNIEGSVSVKYVIDVDKDSPDRSRLSLYIGDNLLVNDIPLFEKMTNVEVIDSIRFKNFNNSDSSPQGKLQITNIQVAVYE